MEMQRVLRKILSYVKQSLLVDFARVADFTTYCLLFQHVLDVLLGTKQFDVCTYV